MRQGSKVLYLQMRKNYLAQNQNARIGWKHIKTFGRIAKWRILILDDFGLANLDQTTTNDLMENH